MILFSDWLRLMELSQSKWEENLTLGFEWLGTSQEIIAFNTTFFFPLVGTFEQKNSGIICYK